MRSVFEIAYRYLVPAIRRELVRRLLEKGFMEVEVSRILRISHSLVSRYASGERGYNIDLSRYRDVMDRIELLAERIASGEAAYYRIYEEIDRIALYTLSRKYICSIHRAIDPHIDPAECNICPNLFTAPHQQKIACDKQIYGPL